MAIPVADLEDPRLELYRGVRDPELLRDHGAFIAEGRLVVERLLAQSHFRARSVLVTPAALASLRRKSDVSDVGGLGKPLVFAGVFDTHVRPSRVEAAGFVRKVSRIAQASR